MAGNEALESYRSTGLIHGVDLHTYISLFSGVAGLDLGIKIAFPQTRCIAYCENNKAASDRLQCRIADGSIDDAPIWDDVRTFPSQLYRGRAGGIVAGFPCPDYSVAGKRAGIVGKHGQLWNALKRVIHDVGPEWVALENVRGLLVPHAYPRWRWDRERRTWAQYRLPAGLAFVLGDLADLGFDAEWGMLSASSVQASHGRPRVFILAYQPGRGFRIDGSAPGESGYADKRNGELADARRQPEARIEPAISGGGQSHGAAAFGGGGGLEHPECPRCDIVENACGGPSTEGRKSTTREALSGRSQPGPSGSSGVLADSSNRQLSLSGRGSGRRDGPGSASAILADTSTEGSPRPEQSELPGAERIDEGRAVEQLRSAPVEDPARSATAGGRSRRRRGIRGSGYELGTFAPGPSDPSWPAILDSLPHLAPALSPVTAALAIALQQGTLDLQAEIEPQLCRFSDGVARWLVERRPRLQCGGNGVVPLQAAAVFRVLAEGLGLCGRRSSTTAQ